MEFWLCRMEIREFKVEALTVRPMCMRVEHENWKINLIFKIQL